MKYQLTEEAVKDIEEILDYTIDDFGVDQAQYYFDALKESIELLADNPEMGRKADEILSGYYRFPFKSHVIFYKSLPHSILVVRILHQRMDPELHLIEE